MEGKGCAYGEEERGGERQAGRVRPNAEHIAAGSEAQDHQPHTSVSQQSIEHGGEQDGEHQVAQKPQWDVEGRCQVPQRQAEGVAVVAPDGVTTPEDVETTLALPARGKSAPSAFAPAPEKGEDVPREVGEEQRGEAALPFGEEKCPRHSCLRHSQEEEVAGEKEKGGDGHPGQRLRKEPLARIEQRKFRCVLPTWGSAHGVDEHHGQGERKAQPCDVGKRRMRHDELRFSWNQI